MIKGFVPGDVGSDDASRPAEEIASRGVASPADSRFIHLPDVVVAVGVTAGAGEQRPVGRLARVVIVEPLHTARASIVKADGNAFVARFAVERWLHGLQRVIALDIQTVVVIARRVRRLEHVEVEPGASCSLMDESPGPTGWNVFRCAPPSPSVKPAAIASMIARSSSLVIERSPPRIQMTALSLYRAPRKRPYCRALVGLNAALPSAQWLPQVGSIPMNIPSSSALLTMKSTWRK